jgi:hypothetical protein
MRPEPDQTHSRSLITCVWFYQHSAAVPWK